MSKFQAVSVWVLVFTFSLLCNQSTIGQISGDWKVSIKPYLSDNSPLSVISVATDFRKGGSINKIRLSFGEVGKRKPVARFRLGWVMVDESKNEMIVGSGESLDIGQFQKYAF